MVSGRDPAEIASAGKCGKRAQPVIGSEFADPVLAVRARNLVEGIRVVVEAQPVGRKAIQALIDGAAAQVQHSLVVDGPTDAQARSEIGDVGGVEVFLRILRRAEERDAARRALREPCRTGQARQLRDRWTSPGPSSSLLLGVQHVLGLHVVDDAARHVAALARAIVIPAQAHLHGQLGVHLPVVHHVGGLVPSVGRDVPVAPVEVTCTNPS